MSDKEGDLWARIVSLWYDTLPTNVTVSGDAYVKFKEEVKDIAEEYAKAVLEDYIKTHSAETHSVTSTVNSTYPFGIYSNDDIRKESAECASSVGNDLWNSVIKYKNDMDKYTIPEDSKGYCAQDKPTIFYKLDNSEFLKQETKDGITRWFKNDKPISYEEFEKGVDEFMKNKNASTTFAGKYEYTVPKPSNWHTREEIEKIREMYGDRFANGFGALRTDSANVAPSTSEFIPEVLIPSSTRSVDDGIKLTPSLTHSGIVDKKPNKPAFIYNHDPIGRVEVNDSSSMPLSDEDIKSALQGAIKAVEDKHLCGISFPKFGGKGSLEKELKPQPSKFKVGDPDYLYGRVYSDLEGHGVKSSSAKTEVKNKYGIGQRAFVINQNEISDLEICDITTTEDGSLLYTAYDDYGTDFNLSEEEVFTTRKELLTHLSNLAGEL